jgi:hypothetical protein
MPPGEIERIGELLVEEGVLTTEELARALTESGLKGSVLGTLLEGCVHVRRAELAAFLAARFRPPQIEDLRKIELSLDAAKLVPEEIARKHETIPVARIGDVLCVAKANYYNRAAVQELRKVSGLKVKVLQADEAQVRAALEIVYKGRKAELPPPGGPKKETGIRSSTSRIPLAKPAPPPVPVAAAAAADDMPLISMPGNDLEEVARPAPVADDLNEVIEVLDAIPIPAGEFATASSAPMARLVLEFDEVFRHGKPASPRFN